MLAIDWLRISLGTTSNWTGEEDFCNLLPKPQRTSASLTWNLRKIWVILSMSFPFGKCFVDITVLKYQKQISYRYGFDIELPPLKCFENSLFDMHYLPCGL